MTGQGFFFKCTSLHDWQKSLDLQFLDYWKMHLRDSPALTMSQSLTVHVEQSPKKFTQNICHEKLPSILYGTKHYALAPLGNLVGVYPSIFARKCRIKLAKILNLAKRILRQNSEIMHYIRIGMFSVETPQSTPSRFIISSSNYFFLQV